LRRTNFGRGHHGDATGQRFGNRESERLVVRELEEEIVGGQHRCDLCSRAVTAVGGNARIEVTEERSVVRPQRVVADDVDGELACEVAELSRGCDEVVESLADRDATEDEDAQRCARCPDVISHGREEVVVDHVAHDGHPVGIDVVVGDEVFPKDRGDCEHCGCPVNVSSLADRSRPHPRHHEQWSEHPLAPTSEWPLPTEPPELTGSMHARMGDDGGKVRPSGKTEDLDGGELVEHVEWLRPMVLEEGPGSERPPTSRGDLRGEHLGDGVAGVPLAEREPTAHRVHGDARHVSERVGCVRLDRDRHEAVNGDAPGNEVLEEQTGNAGGTPDARVGHRSHVGDPQRSVDVHRWRWRRTDDASTTGGAGHHQPHCGLRHTELEHSEESPRGTADDRGVPPESHPAPNDAFEWLPSIREVTACLTWVSSVEEPVVGDESTAPCPLSDREGPWRVRDDEIGGVTHRAESLDAVSEVAIFVGEGERWVEASDCPKRISAICDVAGEVSPAGQVVNRVLVERIERHRLHHTANAHPLGMSRQDAERRLQPSVVGDGVVVGEGDDRTARVANGTVARSTRASATGWHHRDARVELGGPAGITPIVAQDDLRTAIYGIELWEEVLQASPEQLWAVEGRDDDADGEAHAHPFGSLSAV